MPFLQAPLYSPFLYLPKPAFNSDEAAALPRSASGDQDGGLLRSGSQIGSVQGGPTQPNLLGRSFSEFCSSVALSVREVRHRQEGCICADTHRSGWGCC